MKFLKNIKPIYFVVAVIVVVALIIAVVYDTNHSSKTVSKKTAPPVGQISSGFSVGANGDARINGAVVTSIENGIISASSSIQNIPVQFTIKTDKNTLYHVFGNTNGSLSNISVGDVLTVAASIESLSPSIVVVAKDVRDSGKFDPSAATRVRAPIVPRTATSSKPVTATTSKTTAKPIIKK